MILHRDGSDEARVADLMKRIADLMKRIADLMKRIADLMKRIADLERQRDIYKESNKGYQRTAQNILEIKKERDTAHAAAIQAAAQICEDWSTSCWDSFRDQAMAVAQRAVNIRALASTDAQRCYDLRIAEAVKNEIVWWMTRSSTTLVHDDLDCTCEEHLRLASASAEVKRLKG